MQRAASILLLALFASFAAGTVPALAQTCTVAPGDYVDADPRDDNVAPAYVLEAAGDPCYVTLRVLTLPGQEFDSYTPAYYESFLQPLVGDPPHNKDYGCPYAPGDAADLRDQYGNWYPARITGSDRYCGYDTEYTMDFEIKTFGATDADLRPATLVAPTPKEMDEQVKKKQAASLCPLGGVIKDYAGDDMESTMKRAVVTEIALQTGARPSVFFDRIRAGETAIAAAGSIYLQRNPEASLNSTIYPFRLETTVCVPSIEGPAEVSRFGFDYSCYTDRFGDFACRRDSARALE